MFAGNISPRKPPNSATVQCGFPIADRDAGPRQPQSRGPIVAMLGQTMQWPGHTDHPVSRRCLHLNQLLALHVIGSRRARWILTDTAKIYRRIRVRVRTVGQQAAHGETLTIRD
jgi:hypothetical protein